MDINKIIDQTRTLTIPFGDESLTITYRPNALNAHLEREEIQLREQGFSFSIAAFQLAKVVTAWDLTRDGEPVEPTQDEFESLGVAICQVIQAAILRDVFSGAAVTGGGTDA